MSRIDKAIELAAKKKQSIVPLAEPKIEEPQETQEHSISAAGYDKLESIPVDNPLFAPLMDPNGLAAEQYKKLRSLVIRNASHGDSRNSLLITSAVPGEGKSLTAMNLALSLARATDYSVVLIDTDLRNPQLHRMLDIEPELGLVNYLREEVSVEDVMHKIGLGNLVLIPAGERIQDPLALLTSKRMENLVGELKSRYKDRFVILDTPPVLPFADLKVLGGLVDNIIFVCREGHSNMDQIEQGLEAVSEYNLLGMVCNDMTMSQSSDYSHYYGLK